MRLTRTAIAKLEADGQTVTLAAVCNATRELDHQGRGLQPITLLRNPEAAALFRQHSPAFQERQQKAAAAKRQRPKVNADARVAYRGLRSVDLIQIVEDLKTQMAEMQVQQNQFKTERDEAYRLRDEALQQNAQQFAALTQLTGQTPSAKHKR